MPLEVALLEEQDIEAFAKVDAEAMAGWPYAEAMMIPGTDRQQAVIGWLRSAWGKDPTANWLKVTDTDTGELIAGALWTLILDPETNPETIRKQRQEDPGVSDMYRESRRLGQEFDAEFVGDVPRAILNILVTQPKHQRRGAGGMLVQWGCKKADELGIICVLTASEAGLVGYIKHGFEVKKIAELDLRPYGYDATELRRFMIRPAKSSA